MKKIKVQYKGNDAVLFSGGGYFGEVKKDDIINITEELFKIELQTKIIVGNEQKPLWLKVKETKETMK